MLILGRGKGQAVNIYKDGKIVGQVIKLEKNKLGFKFDPSYDIRRQEIDQDDKN